MDRRAAVDALARLAFAAELLDDPRVDAKSASGLSWAIRSMQGDVATLWANGDIERMDGMTAPLLAVVDDVLHDREPPLLADVERAIPPGLLEIRKLKGLGPKKIRALWQKLEITSMGELEYACNENRLIELDGFGTKTQQSLLEQIAALRERAGMMRLDQARRLGERVITALAPARAVLVGDARRGCELVRAVVVVTDADAARAKEAHGSLGEDGAHVEIVRAADGFGWGVVEHTGSVEHVALLQRRASQKSVPASEIKKCASEEDVYALLGLVVTEPERREEHVPLVEQGGARPRLITRADVRGALHNHTTRSDGVATLLEMRNGAAARGLTYLGVTDHSQTASYAHGLRTSDLEDQRGEIAALNAGLDVNASVAGRCVLLCGVESDILREGELDYPDDVLKKLEVVVASVHNRFGQKGGPLTQRMVNAARHRLTDIVGHPTGRLLLGRAPSEYDVSALLAACAESGCAVELNANPARLDLNERHLAEAKERGVIVSIAADAHSVEALDHIDYGISIARRAGLTADDVLNTRTLPELRAWLATRRKRGAAA